VGDSFDLFFLGRKAASQHIPNIAIIYASIARSCRSETQRTAARTDKQTAAAVTAAAAAAITNHTVKVLRAARVVEFPSIVASEVER
jgi:hypothetical protein